MKSFRATPPSPSREYLDQNPHTIIAMKLTRLDIYKPTRDCLLAIRDRLTQGSVIGFDELNDQVAPAKRPP